MATTKIWPIRDNLKRVVDYARNPEKTENDDLKKTLHYAAQEKKTVSKDERFCFVTGVGCSAESAYEEMCSVKERFGKQGGNVSYHAYQSFKHGEVTPEQCHEIGIKLAKRLWGKRFQVLVATHLDKGHLHSHFVINSVSYVDGKKFNDNYKAYNDMREASDQLCKEYELSVVKNPKGRTPRSIYFAEKNGEPTKYNLMREAIDTAIKISSNRKDFETALRDMGYFWGDDPNRKYGTIRRIGDKKPVRLYQLGEEYDVQRVRERINENYYRYGAQLYRRSQTFYTPPKIRRFEFHGSFNKSKKITGFKALYLHYCYLLGVYPKRENRPKPLSPQMREAVRRMDEISKQIRLICKYDLKTDIDVNALINNNTEAMKQLKKERDGCYNRLRRCDDPAIIHEIKTQRDSISARMAALRNENRVAAKIPVRAAVMKEDIKIERQMHSEHSRRQPQKNKTKDRSDAR